MGDIIVKKLKGAIKMIFHKKQMEEAAVLYYEKNLTQNEIAKKMNLSRQTVSKLLNDAIKENIVEIKIHNPETVCKELENEICKKFNIKNAVICGVSTNEHSLCQMMTVRKAAEYIGVLAEKGNNKIAISWGRTVQMLVENLQNANNSQNIVFPLFGATDQEQAYYLSNELARSFADKIGAKVNYAYFPYIPDCVEDCELFKKTSYYKKLNELWENIDIAVVGIGDKKIIEAFGKIFGYNKKGVSVIGDIATHFFNNKGEFVELYENKLCATRENLKNAKQTIAIACGEEKTQAIIGALRSGVIDTLITDEYTARNILSF